jgi:hypothetical protein
MEKMWYTTLLFREYLQLRSQSNQTWNVNTILGMVQSSIGAIVMIAALIIARQILKRSESGHDLFV